MNRGLSLGLMLGGMSGGDASYRPAPYTTGAVSFNGSSTVQRATAFSDLADSGLCTTSLWLWVPGVAASGSEAGGTGFVLHIGSDDFLYFIGVSNWGETDTTAQLTVVANENASGVNFAEWVYSDPHTPGTILTNGEWHHILISTDTNHAEGDKLCSMVFDGVDLNATLAYDAPAFITAFSGEGGAVPDWDDDVPPICYMADVWSAPGQYVTDASLFRDPVTGKPKDLGADGSTPTGTAPAIFVRRASSASANTFATNLGTGGNFTITGTLTSAPTSPSD